jgi:hypothetical protein
LSIWARAISRAFSRSGAAGTVVLLRLDVGVPICEGR